MFSSTSRTTYRRYRARRDSIVTLATVVLALLGSLAVNAMPAAAASVAACSAPAAASIIAQTPWPQARYDLNAVTRITDGLGAVVAVVDSGVDATNAQLVGAVLPGADTLDPGADGRRDCVGHGTAVASIIAARPRSGSGLRGLAPAAKIFPVRVSERTQTEGRTSGEGDVADLAAGIRAAVAHRPRPTVINLSISTTKDDDRLREAIRAALAADIVVVAAAGNQHAEGDPTPYPASYPGVVGVGAVNESGQRVPSSQVGSYVDIVAPGDNIVAAAPRGGHRSFEGTSFAAAFVSATAALVRAHFPELHQAEVVRRLLATTEPAPGERPSPEYGYGMLSPLRALTAIVPAAGTVRTESSNPSTPATQLETAPSAPSGPSPLILVSAIVLIAAATVFAVVAATIPAARRRRWRPEATAGLFSTTHDDPGERARSGPAARS